MFLKLHNGCFPKITVKNGYKNPKPYFHNAGRMQLRRRMNYVYHQNKFTHFPGKRNVKNVKIYEITWQCRIQSLLRFI